VGLTGRGAVVYPCGMPRTRPTLTPFSDFRLDFTPMAQRRRYLGMSQRQLADAIGVHRVTLNRVEQNRTLPSYALTLSVARALGTPMHQLVIVIDGRTAAVNGRT